MSSQPFTTCVGVTARYRREARASSAIHTWGLTSLRLRGSDPVKNRWPKRTTKTTKGCLESKPSLTGSDPVSLYTAWPLSVGRSRNEPMPIAADAGFARVRSLTPARDQNI